MGRRSSHEGRSSSHPALPCLAAAIGLALTLWAFYPGYMSQDSAQQYRQARSGELDTQHPPLMAMIWRLTDRVLPGPGGIFALFALIYWSGLAMAAHAMRRGWVGAVAVLGIGLWPPMIGLLAHVWKDVGLMATFMLAGGLLVRESRRPSRVLLVMAFVLIALGAAFRHNGLFAALPFMPYLASRWSKRIVAVALLAALVTAAVAKLPDYLPHVRRVSMWPTVALWDLAAVSIDERRILIPDSVLRPGLTLQELESHFVPFTNTSTFQTNEIVVKPDGNLLRAWLALPLQHPGGYWRHRWRLTRLLFGSGATGRPSYLVLQPEVQQLAGNPPIAPNRSALNRWAIIRLLRLIDTPLFGGWPYVVIAATALVRSRNTLAATIAASGLCYAVPLIVISGAADFRYLGWLVASSLIAALLRFANT